MFVDGISEIRITWTGCLFDSFGGESFETKLIVYFVFVMVDCIFVSECLNRLIVSEFGFVLQLGKIVACIEQKPVSLNDICDVWNSYQKWTRLLNECTSLIVTVNLFDDSCSKAFWLLLMIFCYLCQCFCIVKYILSKSWMFLCFSFWMGNAYCEK